MVEWAASVTGGEEDEPSASQQSQQKRSPTPIFPLYLLTYIPDRLYLASYTTPPTQDTLFPYPDRQPSRRSPSKRSARAVDGPSAVLSERDRTPPYYFSIDDSLLYNAFHHDFGPLHIGHLYRFAVQFHDILGAPENKDKPVVFWSKADARSKFFTDALKIWKLMRQNRSSKCCLYSRILHGSYPVMGATSCACADSTSRPTADAIP